MTTFTHSSNEAAAAGVADPEKLLSRRHDSPHWWYDFTIYGRRFRGSTKTEDKWDAVRTAVAEHKRAWSDLLGEPSEADPDDGEPSTITIADAFERFWSEHLRFVSQARAERRRLERLLLTLPEGITLCQVRRHHIKSFVTARREDVGPATINRALSLFRKLNNMAKEDWEKDACTFRISKYMLPEPKGRERYLRAGDMPEFLKHLVPHARAPIVLALLTGLRRSNITQLRWREVDLIEKRITVHIKTRTSQRKPHCVTLAEQAVEMLRVLQPASYSRDDFVFFYRHPHVDCDCAACRHRPDLAGQPIKEMKRTIKTAARNAGISHVRFHDFRHTLASWVLNSGHSLKIVQEILGHSDIRTTQRYAHLERTVADQALQKTIEKQEQAAGISFGTIDKPALPPPKRQRLEPAVWMAGAAGFEPATYGFGDHGSSASDTPNVPIHQSRSCTASDSTCSQPASNAVQCDTGSVPLQEQPEAA